MNEKLDLTTEYGEIDDETWNAAKICHQVDMDVRNIVINHHRQHESYQPPSKSKCWEKEGCEYYKFPDQNYCSVYLSDNLPNNQTKNTFSNERAKRERQLERFNSTEDPLFFPLDLVQGIFPKWSPDVEKLLRPASFYDIVVFVSHRWETGSCPDLSFYRGDAVKAMASKGFTRKQNINDYAWNPCIFDGASLINVNGQDPRPPGKVYHSSNIGVFYDWTCLPQLPRTTDEVKLFTARLNGIFNYSKRIQSFFILPSPDYNSRMWCIFECAMCLLGMKNFHVSSTGCRLPDEIRYIQRLLTSITYCLDSILEKFVNNVGYDECKFHSSFREKLQCEKCISRLRCMCGVKYAGAYVGIGCLSGIIAATVLIVFRRSIVSNPDDVSLILKLFHRKLLDCLDSPLKRLIRMENDVTADHSLLEAVQFITTDNLADFNADIVISEVKEFMERYPTGYCLFDSHDQNQYSFLSL